jgi:GTP-binding protein LepA
MEYTYKGEEYILNLIDTLATWIFRMKFRSIAACEGHFDCRCSTKHTSSNISNLYLALEMTWIPVLNKVDLPSANPEEVS